MRTAAALEVPRRARRAVIVGGLTSSATALASVALREPAVASRPRDIESGALYEVQRTRAEWGAALSEQQYFVLRDGGTEPKFSSVLLAEKGRGTYRCAGCDAPLFDSQYKFDSGTGWPSFARALPAVDVERQALGPAQTALLGAEARCGRCGGHLGDLFLDGFLWVGSPAFFSGNRYCINGA
eukprot:CAMPEP_0119058550 /NCGR_PEP_ID=MMETSP1178-20130426/2832_1 /TAXON_ID=33656 /ORGANISM="unid sp, Strain CCMP2000" /LENGTH=182 /DNA_ID=CAMNT_0007039493 /DNA_START=36 /DNA_END=581 /DNA_ORIENTATION=+